MVILGVPYSWEGLLNVSEITVARFQGRHLEAISKWLACGSKL